MTRRRETWSHGEVLVRREVLGLSPLAGDTSAAAWCGDTWSACPVYVVEDSSEHLVTYIPPGAELGFPAGRWPTRDGRHPWHGRGSWSGHGCLMVQRPGDHHAVWHFWEGPDREFACWYVNLQTAFVRRSAGYDTQDLELDLVVLPDGTWQLKDLDVLDDRVREGRYSQELAEWVVALGTDLGAALDAGDHWWDHAWADWIPEPTWRDLALPAGWDGTTDPATT